MFRHNARLRKRRPSSPPIFGRGGEEASLLLPSRFREGSAGRAGRWAHLRTGGEEECARTGDTDPGCNYLVRGYCSSMHYFWRGDMPHISPPLPFQWGRVGCQDTDAPRPGLGSGGDAAACWRATGPRTPRPAWSCVPSISAGTAPLAGAGQGTPLQAEAGQAHPPRPSAAGLGTRPWQQAPLQMGARLGPVVPQHGCDLRNLKLACRPGMSTGSPPPPCRPPACAGLRKCLQHGPRPCFQTTFDSAHNAILR